MLRFGGAPAENTTMGTIGGWGRALRGALPRGGTLPEDLWEARHRTILVILWSHVVGIPVFSIVMGQGLGHMVVDVLPVVLLGACASLRLGSGRRTRAVLASLGLLTASAVLVHLADGSTEMHFHFFVMVGLIALYQDWRPFLTSIAFVALHHAVVGVLIPEAVYGHDAARQRPLEWAAIHAVFVLAASVAQITTWRVTETQHERAEQALLHQAFHDALTGLPNRSLFADRVGRAISAQRRHDRPTSAVLFVDLDDFKLVNDGMGHVTGDELLIEAGRRITTCLRPGDTCARLGGDEFGVLLEEVGDAAYEAGMRVLHALQGDVRTTAGVVPLDASIGLAFAGGDAEVDDVVRNADLAMYRAKARGKGRLEAFEVGMREAALERLALKADMQRALEVSEFVPHYQPVISLAHGRTVGVEALVRWEHPTRGRLAPAAFIELAEENGAIIDIGRAVLRQACTDAMGWPSSIGLSVNLSVRQLQHDGLVADVAEALRSTGLAPSRLTLEITESVLVADPDAAAEVLASLKALGVSIALDDFGTGYSSLSYLNRFPVDTLKVDKSFIDALDAGGSNHAALLQAIVGLGRTLELNVVAEGIEQEEQVAILKQLGCGLGQGYLFARPMPNDELIVWSSVVREPA